MYQNDAHAIAVDEFEKMKTKSMILEEIVDIEDVLKEVKVLLKEDQIEEASDKLSAIPDILGKESKTSLDVLNLSARPYYALHRSGIYDAESLEEIDFFDLKTIKGLGKKSLDEIMAKLKNYEQGNYVRVRNKA